MTATRIHEIDRMRKARREQEPEAARLLFAWADAVQANDPDAARLLERAKTAALSARRHWSEVER